MRTRLVVLPLLVSGLVFPRDASAQSSRGAIPEELARALLGGGPEAPTITVGRAPDGIPAAVLPTPRTSVLGGVAYPRRSRAVVVVPGTPADALSAYQSRMESAGGWRRPPGLLEPPRGGGFLAAPAQERGVMLCGADSTHLSAMAAPRPEGGSYLHLTVSRPADGYTPCAPRPAQREDDVPFPALRSPEGAVVRTGRGSSSSGGTDGRIDERYASAELETSSSPAELVASYTGQLRSAGWTVDAPAASESAAVVTASLQDARGERWHAVVSVISLPGTRREGSLRVLRLSAR